MTVPDFSPQLFPLLGVQAAIGRTFTQEENVPGRAVRVDPMIALRYE